MPVLKTRCPKCDTSIRRTVAEPGEYDLKCPDCGHIFIADTDDEGDCDEGADERPGRYQPRAAGKSNTPIILGAVAGVLVVVGAIVGLTLAFGGKDNKPVAQNNDPPAKAKANPAPKPNANPPKKNPAPEPKADPVEPNPTAPAVPPGPVGPPVRPPVGAPSIPPDGMPEEAVVVPPRPAPDDDPFAKAAAFKPDGALPELPPLPAADQRPLLVLDPGGHTAFPKHVFFTPDASRVLSVAEDKSVRAWDVASGEAVYTVRLPAGPEFEGAPFSAVLSPDGKVLAVGVLPLGRGKLGTRIYLLEAETGELAATVSGAVNSAVALDFAPDGRRMAVGCADGTLQVYDLAAQKWVYRAATGGGRVERVRFSPAGDRIAAVGRVKEVTIWDPADDAKPAARISLAAEGPLDADWTADGKALAVGCVDGTVRFFDATGRPGRVVPPALEDRTGRPMHVVRLRLLPGDKRFVFAGNAGTGWAGVADVATGERPVIIREHTNTVMAVGRSADGALGVSAGGASNEILVWEVATGTVVRRLQSASQALWSVGWAKDGRSIAWGASNRVVEDLGPLEQALRLEDYQLLPRPQPDAYARHIRTDGALAIRRDSALEFTVSENGKPLYTHKSQHDRIYSISFMPGKGVVVGTAFAMYLLDAKTGNLIRQYRGDTGQTSSLAPSPDGRYFASASSDQVVRVWSPDRDEPVLSIFSVGREWIAWTPQGYYACSPFGERLIAWQVNNGLDKLPSVHPAARFRASLYQPALIKYLIPAGDLKLAMAMAVKFDKQSIAATELAAVLPPAVSVTAPEKVDAKPVTIRAVAEGTEKNPIVAMRLLVDGRPFDGAAGVKKFDKRVKAETAWQVTFGPGAHTVAVMAESPVSKGMSPTATVTRAGAAELPNLYVLAMGVSAYPGPMKLNYAASDALLLTRTLQEKSRKVFDKIETKALTDKECTKKAMQEGLDWLKSKMTAKDVGIVSFSGHGGRDDDTGTFYLIPVDVGRDLAKTCLSGDEFKRRLEDMPGRIVAILDACHSGAVAEIKTARPDNLVRDLTTEDYGVVVLAASLGTECALESRTTKAGFFTLGLTEGMSGKADFNKDGVIHLNELERYAMLRVQQLSRGEQNPTVGRPPNIRPFPIAKP